MTPAKEAKETQESKEAKDPKGTDPRRELNEMQDRFLRLQADFDNAKKRWLKEQAEIQEFANGDLLRQLLEIADDFERALQVGANVKEESVFRTGVKMIGKRIEEFFRSYGVVPMEAVGQLFDPERHEAVAHEETTEVPESTVIAELRKGYWMNGRVLRHAVVKVAVSPKNRKMPDTRDQLPGNEEDHSPGSS